MVVAKNANDHKKERTNTMSTDSSNPNRSIEQFTAAFEQAPEHTHFVEVFTMEPVGENGDYENTVVTRCYADEDAAAVIALYVATLNTNPLPGDDETYWVVFAGELAHEA